MSDHFTLHHVSLFVRDVDASAAFYADVLGLEEIPNRVGQAHIRWFTIDGFRTVHLIGGDPEAERPRPFATSPSGQTAFGRSTSKTLTVTGLRSTMPTPSPERRY
jgi:catechol 2,3-dioxygenase-like lactoylglutathione lyase family enzyme